MIRDRNYAEPGCLSCEHFADLGPIDMLVGRCKALGGAIQDWPEVNAMQTCADHKRTRTGRALYIEPEDVTAEGREPNE